jgi:hypothetical protein
MDRLEAVALARTNAILFGREHSYVSSTFEPHEWVVKAIMSAYSEGKNDGYDEGVRDGYRDGYTEAKEDE